MAKKKKDTGGTGAGTDLLDRDESKEKLVPPSKYKIVYYNDDFTPMNLVTISLMTIYKHSQDKAEQIMMNVHTKGREIVKNGLSKEIADTKVDETLAFFARFGYPLHCEAEKC